MSLRVIGAGVGRTGTHSLKLALERLIGAPCYHMMEVFPRPGHFERWTDAALGKPVDWQALFEGFSATVDWPSASFWRELSAAYPDAIILLSTRPSEAWWTSAMDTIFAGRTTPPPAMRVMFDAMMESRFTANPRDHDAAIAAYERHNADVRANAPRNRLVDWTPGDGWQPLCQALGVPVPAEPFPHSNTGAEFKARTFPARPTTEEAS